MERIRLTYYNIIGEQVLEGTRDELQNDVDRLFNCDIPYHITIIKEDRLTNLQKVLAYKLLP